MKRNVMLSLLIISLILFTGCIQEKVEETTTTTSTMSTTTTTTTTTSTTTSTTSTTTTTLAIDSTCIEYCLDNGYLGGKCRLNRFECDIRLEEKIESRKKIESQNLCLDRRYDTCCCQTNESIEKSRGETQTQ